MGAELNRDGCGRWIGQARRLSAVGAFPPPRLLAFLLLFGLPGAVPCLAGESRFDLIPKWVRPDGLVTVRLGGEVDVSKKMFLRLTGRAEVKDLPLDGAQVRRRIAEIRIPTPLRQGTHKAELVDEGGQSLASGPDLKVAASEQPVITAIAPQASYPTNGKYDFELFCEKIASDPEDVDIRVNDVQVDFKRRLADPSRRMSVRDCGNQVPCLIWNWRSLRIFGLGLTDQDFHRPMSLSVEVDGIASDKKPLLLSPVDRSAPRAIAFVALGLLVLVVYLFSRQKAAEYKAFGRRYATLTWLFIDPETNTYSLNRFQLILWVAAAAMAYVYLAASQFLIQWRWELPPVPEGLPALLGISVGTAALAVGAAGARGGKGAGAVHPGLGDFITTGGVLAPERLQFFLWTILGVVGFISATLAQDPATVTELPKVPENFIPLMGISSLGYLAGKVIRKPGPVVKQLVPPPPYAAPAAGVPGKIVIVGENLSPRAQVRLNGVLLPADQVVPGLQQPAGAEFVRELIVTPQAVAQPVPGVASVKVTNPDEQSAEM